MEDTRDSARTCARLRAARAAAAAMQPKNSKKMSKEPLGVGSPPARGSIAQGLCDSGGGQQVALEVTVVCVRASYKRG